MMKRQAWYMVLAVLVLALGVTVPWVSAEQPPAEARQAQRAGLFLVGRVVSVQGDALTVETPDGTWTVTTDGDTVLRMGPEVEDLSDIQPGKGVMVRGRVIDDATLHATTIARPPNPGADAGITIERLQQARRLQRSWRGEITSVSSDEIVVALGEESRSLPLGAETKYRVPDIEEPSWSDLEIGQLVVVVPGAEGEPVRAVAVVTDRQMQRINAQQRQLRRVRQVVANQGIRGTVVSIGGSTITIDTPRGQRVVNTDQDTRFRLGRDQEAEFGDIQMGDELLVMGQPDPTCPLEAKGVVLLPERPDTTP